MESAADPRSTWRRCLHALVASLSIGLLVVAVPSAVAQEGAAVCGSDPTGDARIDSGERPPEDHQPSGEPDDPGSDLVEMCLESTAEGLVLTGRTRGDGVPPSETTSSRLQFALVTPGDTSAFPNVWITIDQQTVDASVIAYGSGGLEPASCAVPAQVEGARSQVVVPWSCLDVRGEVELRGYVIRQRAETWIDNLDQPVTATLVLPPAAVQRLPGATPAEAALSISRQAFPDDADVVHLAREDGIADALTAAGLHGGPVLLVPACGALPESVAEEVRRLGPHRVTAIGGDAAVCQAMLDEASVAAGDGSRIPAGSGPVCAEDPLGDVQPRNPGDLPAGHGDTTAACADLDADVLTLRVEVADMGPAEPSDDDPYGIERSVIWDLETPSGRWTARARFGRHGQRDGFSDSPDVPDGSQFCGALPVTLDDAGAELAVPRTCLGGAEQVTVRGGSVAVFGEGVDDLPAMSVGLVAAPGGVPQTRLAGASRFETAAAIAGVTHPDRSDVAYLGRADVFADTIASGTLRDGPVLLTPPCGPVHPATAAVLQRLRPARVIALGGEAAVCSATLEAAAAAAAGPGQPVSRCYDDPAEGTHPDVLELCLTSSPSGLTLAVTFDRADADAAFTGHIAADIPPGTFIKTHEVIVEGGTARSRVADAPAAETCAQQTPPTQDGATVAVTVPWSCLGRPDHVQAYAEAGTDLVPNLPDRPEAPALSEPLPAQVGGAAVGRLAGPKRMATAVAISRSAFPSVSDEARLASVFDADLPFGVAAGADDDGPLLLIPSCGDLPAEVATEIARLQPLVVQPIGDPDMVCDQIAADAAAAARPGAS